MTEPAVPAAPQPAAPSPSPAPAGLSHDAYSRLSAEEQGAYSQVKQNDPDAGSHWVKRDALPPDTPSSPSSSRPAWAPEGTWDENGLNHEKFGAWYRENVQPALDRQAAKAALPQSAADYGDVKPTAALKLAPDEIALNPAEPFWQKAKDWGIKTGLSKEAFAEAADLVIARDSLSRAQVKAAINSEIQKLGPAGHNRMQAIKQFYEGFLGAEDATRVMSRIWTAADVRMHEAVVAKFAGHTAPPAPRREPGISEEAWAKMDPGERLRYAREYGNGAR